MSRADQLQGIRTELLALTERLCEIGCTFPGRTCLIRSAICNARVDMLSAVDRLGSAFPAPAAVSA
jgi:hypothetical protein